MKRSAGEAEERDAAPDPRGPEQRPPVPPGRRNAAEILDGTVGSPASTEPTPACGQSRLRLGAISPTMPLPKNHGRTEMGAFH